jgi:hypothetical protein
MGRASTTSIAVCAVVVLPTWLAAIPPQDSSAEQRVRELLSAFESVGPEGAGNVGAADAWSELQGLDANDIPLLLSAIEVEKPLAANWIRSAVDAIAERTLRQGGSLPRRELESFLAARDNEPRARRLAYEWLLRVDPTAEERWIPKMLKDPSVEFRRDAVARLLAVATRADEAQKKAASAAVELYRLTLEGAHDLDQVEAIVERLRAYGENVDLATHFGFLLRWKVIGPFDNTAEGGFHTVYPPEKKLAFDAGYEGKAGVVRWIDSVSNDEYGVVDLNQVLVKEKELVGYAHHEFSSAAARSAELRVASTNAFKIWVNGLFVYERDEYHHGTKIDHYRVPVRLREGRNSILLKVCQDSMVESWTEPWKFQIRVCDATGTAILSTTRGLRTGGLGETEEEADEKSAGAEG